MSHDTHNMNDPLSFVRSLWSGMGVTMPGMVTPTFDVDELDKRIKDMKAVEGWLRMNLSMLQMTIQGLEMQRTTLGTVQAMSQMASGAAKSMSPEAAAEPVAVDTAAGAFSGAAGAAAMWPWQMMQQMRDQMQQTAEAVQAASEEKAEEAKAAGKRGRK